MLLKINFYLRRLNYLMEINWFVAIFFRDYKDVDFLVNIILYIYYDWFVVRNSRNDKVFVNIEKIFS